MQCFLVSWWVAVKSIVQPQWLLLCLTKHNNTSWMLIFFKCTDTRTPKLIKTVDSTPWETLSSPLKAALGRRSPCPPGEDIPIYTPSNHPSGPKQHWLMSSLKIHSIHSLVLAPSEEETRKSLSPGRHFTSWLQQTHYGLATQRKWRFFSPDCFLRKTTCAILGDVWVLIQSRQGLVYSELWKWLIIAYLLQHLGIIHP